MQPSPIQPSPMQPSPIQPSPMQPSPMQPSPMQPSPQPSTIQPSPMQPQPTSYGIFTVDILDTSIVGHETLQIKFQPQGNSRNVYALFGNAENILSCPLAFQVGPPFGEDYGGISRDLVSSLLTTNPELQYDSWLSVGRQDDNPLKSLTSIGIDFEQWNNAPLNANDGAVFWMNPDDGPTGEAILAQLTLPKSRGPTTFSGGLQGRSNSGDDWQEGFSISLKK